MSRNGRNGRNGRNVKKGKINDKNGKNGEINGENKLFSTHSKNEKENDQVAINNLFPTYRRWSTQIQALFCSQFKVVRPSAADLRWLDKLPWHQHPTDPPVLLEVTPGRAAALLTRVVSNRQPEAKRVAEYSEQMQRGMWEIIGSGMSADTRKHVLDAEHRLRACMDSGKTIYVWMVFGCSSSAVGKIDTNRVRSGSDALVIQRKYSTSTAQLINGIGRRFVRLQLGTTHLHLPHKSLAFEARHRTQLKWLQEEVIAKAKSKRMRNPGVLTALLFAYLRYPLETQRFAQDFIVGTDKSDSPACILRNSKPVLDGVIPKRAPKDTLELLTLLAIQCHVERRPYEQTFNRVLLTAAREFFV